MTEEELYDYKAHTIRGRFGDLTEECCGRIWSLSWLLGSLVVVAGIVIDLCRGEMYQ